MTATATWLDRADADAVVARFVTGDEAPPGAPGLRVLLVDGPPGHGAGTLLAGVPGRAERAGHRPLPARVRATDGVPAWTPDLAAALGVPDAGLARALAAAARTRPTVVALEDAHRLDDHQRRALHELLGRVRHLRLRVVLRCWGGATGPGTLDVDHTEVLTLAPLGVPAVRAGLEADGRAVADGFAEDLVDRTGGVPALVAPVVRAVLRGVPAETEGPGIAEVLAGARREQDARVLHALPAPAVELAVTLGLCGDLPDPDALGPLVGLDSPGVSHALGLLRTGGLLGDGARSVGLRDQALVARVLARVDPGERSAVALRIAERGRLGGLPDEIVGRLLAAVSGPLPTWSAGVLRRAAQRERRRGDPVGGDRGRTRRSAAAAHLRLARRVGGLAAGEEGALRLDEAAELVAVTPELADRRFTEILTGAADPAARIRAADQLVLRRPDRVTRAVVAGALRRRGIEEDERAALQALYWTVRQHDESLDGFGEARVDPLPDFPADPESAGVVALAAARRGGPRTLPRVRALARVALGPGENRTVVSRIAACRALVLAEDLSTARSALAALLVDPAVVGSRVLLAATRLATVDVELRGGRLGPARSALWGALRALPSRAWPTGARAQFLALPAQLALMRGENDHAGRWLAQCRPGWDRERYTWARLRFARGAHRLATGDRAAAVDLLLHCGRALAGSGSTNPAVLPWRSLAAVALHLRGESTAACALAEKEVETARAWAGPGVLGWSLAVLGTVDAGAGASLVGEGVEMLRRSELRHELAVATTMLAGAESDPEVARAAARSAVRLLEETGALRGASALRGLVAAGAGEAEPRAARA